MSDPIYLKCPCGSCGASIEFPGNGVGSSVECPHCREQTTLFDPSSPTPDEGGGPPLEIDSVASNINEDLSEESIASRRSRPALVAIVLVVLLVVGGGAVFFIVRNKPAATQPIEQPMTLATPTSSDGGLKERSSEEASGVLRVGKLPGDFKVSGVTLEKAKGNSLVYAVGVLKNDSDHQRFGVNIELELADAKGNKAGVAKDYRSVIEPRQEWRFRALVLDSKAVSARVSSIREEE